MICFVVCALLKTINNKYVWHPVKLYQDYDTCVRYIKHNTLYSNPNEYLLIPIHYGECLDDIYTEGDACCRITKRDKNIFKRMVNIYEN